MIFIVVKFPIRPDKLDEWEHVREEHTRGARAEEGCLFLDYSRSVDDPNEYICVEAFRDDDAAVHHVNTQAFKDFVERMPDIVSGTRRSSTPRSTRTALARWARSARASSSSVLRAHPPRGAPGPHHRNHGRVPSPDMRPRISAPGPRPPTRPAAACPRERGERE